MPRAAGRHHRRPRPLLQADDRRHPRLGRDRPACGCCGRAGPRCAPSIRWRWSGPRRAPEDGLLRQGRLRRGEGGRRPGHRHRVERVPHARPRQDPPPAEAPGRRRLPEHLRPRRARRRRVPPRGRRPRPAGAGASRGQGEAGGARGRAWRRGQEPRDAKRARRPTPPRGRARS